MPQLTVIASSLLIAFFLDRGLAGRRPGSGRSLAAAVVLGVLAPLAIARIASWAATEADLRFVAFAVAEVLFGYMFASASWVLRALARLAIPLR